MTHTPYRSWCPYCVAARAKDLSHKRCDGEGEEKAIPSVHVDYLLMRDQPGSELVPVARAHDDITKTHETHVVPTKGNIETVADELHLASRIGRGSPAAHLIMAWLVEHWGRDA